MGELCDVAERKSAADPVWLGGSMSVADAVKFSGIPRSNLYALMESGELTYCKIGKRRLIARDSIIALLSRNGPSSRDAGRPAGVAS